MVTKGWVTARRLACGLLVVFSVSVFISCVPVPTVVPTFTYAPTLTASPIPLPSDTPTSLPSHTPTPVPASTPVWTPAPTIVPDTVTVAVRKVRARLAEADVEPLCLRWEDSDGDGAPEWLGLYVRPSDPPRLTAFVLDIDLDAVDDAGTWYDLYPPPKEPGKKDYGLGEYPACEMEVRDTNADGRVEILVWGHAETSIGLLHIFAWDGTSYTLLGAFEGDAGVRLDNADGDLADEISVRYDANSDLVWEAVHTWDGANYGWTWERYDWFYLDRPHSYLTDTPEHVVISFYLAIDDRDIPGAYGLLSGSAQATQSYETWAGGFVTTVAAEVGVVHEQARDGGTATVAAQVLAYDNVDGRVIATLWDVAWTVVQTESGWRLASATTSQLDQWELVYYR